MRIVRLKKMVGFRNIAIHDYQKINTEILKSILDGHLNEFKDFTSILLKFDFDGEALR